MMRQVETTLLSRNYDGFLKKGKLKGKYGHIQGTGAAAGSRTVTVMWVVIALLVLAGAICLQCHAVMERHSLFRK